MQKVQTLKKEDLFQIAIPARTTTYVPVSNKSLINAVDGMLSDYGYKVTSEQFQVAERGQIMIAKYGIQSAHDQVGMMLAFGNSYNKSRKVSIAAGAQVLICCNGMVKGDFVQLRKHMGTISSDLNVLVEDAIRSMDTRHLELLQDTEVMKNYHFADKRELSALIGDMYFNHSFLNSVQLSIIKRELKYSEHFSMNDPKDFTAWNLYNNVTQALKTAHPSLYINSHKALHHLMMRYVKPEFAQEIDWEEALLSDELVANEA